MAQDVVADGLNQIMNAKRAHKNSVQLARYSKVLFGVLAIGKLRGYIKEYKMDGKILTIEFGNVNACRAVKPRYVVKKHMIPRYVKRYLPAREMGVLIISTNQGLLTHHTALEKGLGGSVIAYFY